MNTPLFQQKAQSETQKAKEARERQRAVATNLGKKLNNLATIRDGIPRCCGGNCSPAIRAMFPAVPVVNSAPNEQNEATPTSNQQ